MEKPQNTIPREKFQTEILPIFYTVVFFNGKKSTIHISSKNLRIFSNEMEKL